MGVSRRGSGVIVLKQNLTTHRCRGRNTCVRIIIGFQFIYYYLYYFLPNSCSYSIGVLDPMLLTRILHKATVKPGYKQEVDNGDIIVTNYA